MDHIIEIFRAVRKELGIEMPKDGRTVRLTDVRVRANGGIERANQIG
jgi:hypothetical protein